MASDTKELKKLIFNVLNDDIPLRNLLGGINKVRHANPLQVSEYPCIIYNLRQSTGRFFDEDERTNVFRTYLKIIVFTTDTSSTDIDELADRVHETLHGKSFSNDIINMFYIEEKYRMPFYEDRVKIWRTELNFEVASCVK